MPSVPDNLDSSLLQGRVSGAPQSRKGAGHDGRLPSHTLGPSTPAPSPLADETTQLDVTDLTVLQAVMSNDEPMTAGKAARVTGLAPGCVSQTLEMLCAAGLLRRLNTVIVSYSA